MNRLNRTSRSALLALVLAACQRTPAVPAEAASAEAGRGSSVGAEVAEAARASDAAVNGISAERLRDHVARLSADELEGRGPGTAGDQATRAYLAERLASFGALPGPGSTGWEQAVELVGVTSSLPKTWDFQRGRRTLSLAWYEQYIAGSGVQDSRGSIERAEVVFVGYGIQAPEYGWDDFKGQDVRGKVLLFLNNDPDWDPSLFAGATRLYYGRWTYKYEAAARQGAAGAIIVHTQPSAGYPFQVVQSSWGGKQFSLPAEQPSSLQLKAWLAEPAAAALVELAGKSLDDLRAAARDKAFAPVPLGITTSLRFDNRVERVASANVVGVIPGRDPQLRGEYVVLSAHHDHLGIGKADARGDTVYNGALDNAAGMAQVLAISEAFAAAPPRRSVLVLFPAAEEAGLLGSQYFAEHPPVPAGKLAANVNIDGGNIWGRTRDITQIGRGKSSIDEVVDRLAAHDGRVVSGDQFPDRGSFYRSDQFNFAKIGVPALYLKTGTDVIGRPEGWGKEQILAFEANRYHQPSDQLDASWSFDGMVEDTRLVFRAAAELANADEPPRWRPGDEFEAARTAALQRAGR
jgi:Zn-dependent M28 family amino/carboxypeptidase